MTTAPKASRYYEYTGSTEFEYTYDAWNRLVSVKNKDENNFIARYEYDGLNRRIEKHEYHKVSGAITDSEHYFYNTAWQILEVRKESTLGSGTLKTTAYKQFVYQPYYIDAVLVRYHDKDQDGDFSDNDEENYYTHDSQFNVTTLTDKTGAVLERYKYSAFGVLWITNSTRGTIPNSNYDQEVLYTGQRYDTNTRMYQFRNRYYHPTLGRFINRDPAGYVDGNSLYTAYFAQMGGLDRTGLLSTNLSSWVDRSTDKYINYNYSKIIDQVEQNVQAALRDAKDFFDETRKFIIRDSLIARRLEETIRIKGHLDNSDCKLIKDLLASAQEELDYAKFELETTIQRFLNSGGDLALLMEPDAEFGWNIWDTAGVLLTAIGIPLDGWKQLATIFGGGFAGQAGTWGDPYGMGGSALLTLASILEFNEIGLGLMFTKLDPSKFWWGKAGFQSFGIGAVVALSTYYGYLQKQVIERDTANEVNAFNQHQMNVSSIRNGAWRRGSPAIIKQWADNVNLANERLMRLQELYENCKCKAK